MTAHLHPQLQAAVLCFLEEHAEKSKIVRPGYQGPAGQLQVVVATHSPNLSAWVSSKNLVFFRSVHASADLAEPIEPPSETEFVAVASAIADANGDHPMMMTTEKATFDVTPEAEPVIDEPEDSNVEPAKTVSTVSSLVPLPRRSTRCIPLKELALSDPERRKVDRYLDVTKSALLFGGRVLLVEGIAEALLLPVIAKKYVLKQDQEKFRIFRSAVFVPIDGVDFECYLRLLLTAHNDIRIADRVVVITDGDRIDHAPGVATPGELRKVAYETIAKELIASGVLHVSINTYSLETELVNAGNGALLKGVYLKLHPKSEPKWHAAVALTGDARAAAVQGLFDNTPKGDFAQLLAEAIREGDSFNVPPYLRTAIENVVQ